MTPVWLWLAAALVLGLIELTTGTFIFLLFAVAALLGGLVALVGGSLLAQALAFCAGVIAAIAAAPRLARRLERSSGDARYHVDALVDQLAIVTQAIDPVTGAGMVRIGADYWRARADVPIAEGARVRVAEVSGSKVIVYPAREPHESVTGERMVESTSTDPSVAVERHDT